MVKVNVIAAFIGRSKVQNPEVRVTFKVNVAGRCPMVKYRSKSWGAVSNAAMLLLT